MKKIAIIGLGYVGLPLAIEFSRKNYVLGFDVNNSRISTLNKGIDINNDLEHKELIYLKNKKKISFTSDHRLLKDFNFFIITVPTPVKKNNNPELKYIIRATLTVAKYLKKDDFVIYESTVYPGTTEEICVPILEKNRKMKLNKDFYVGYSPERLSPGSNNHGLKKIIKITSGSNPYASNIVDQLYKSIITKGTYKASSIKVAEAAKVVENVQRDINIAFVNELTLGLSKLNINTKEVLKAAETKWNFSKYQPGMVGGHCIAVDPYYLYNKFLLNGYKSLLIPSSRKINDHMPIFFAKQLIKILRKKFKTPFKKKKILLMGFAYKENSSDTRNTPVFIVYKYLLKFFYSVDIYDPLVSKKMINHLFGIDVLDKVNKKYDGIIMAVPHRKILKYYLKNKSKFTNKNSVIIDIKYVLNSSDKRVISF